jgi:hypothetical protein
MNWRVEDLNESNRSDKGNCDASGDEEDGVRD